MKKDGKILVLNFSILIFVLFAHSVFADNPIVQTVYTADPAPLVHNGVFYVYAGHDEDSANGWFYMIDWRCYSSTDMANWTDLGTPMNLNTFSWKNVDAWAGQCVYRNNKFYFYVPIRISGDNFGIGVGVSDKPEGPFTDAIGKPLITGNGYIDPTVFIDDDGQAYMYWGNPGSWMVKLNSDMISYSGNVQEMPQNAQTVGNMYAEAPWLYKRNGTYYFVFATDDTGEQSVAYSTSSSPTGPWTFKSKIMNPSGTSWTCHPGIADYMGNSYLVYNNGILPGGDAFHRSVCIDQFTYNSNGTIPMIPATTSGSPQIGTLNPFGQIEAETICWESGVETEKCGEGGMDVCNIENGDYIKIKGVNFGTGATSFEARVASGTNGGNIELRLDSTSGTIVGTCAVAGTGGWQTWVTRSATISGATGTHDLYLRFTGGSGFLFNINWWKFSGGSTPDPTVAPTPDPTPAPTATPNQNPIFSGGPYSLDGTSSSYVDLPDGLTSNISDISIAAWVKLNSIANWTRVFDFGNDTNVYMMLTAASGTTGYPYFGITTSSNTGEQGINGTSPFPAGSWQHMAVIKSGTTGILYINGQEVGRNSGISLNPSDLGNTVNNYIGKSQWSADPYANGTIDKFVVYNRAISASELATLAGTPPDATPAPTAQPACSLIGDVNSSGTIDIVDALLVAQAYVGLIPSGYNAACADVNCSGGIDIVDALLVAQYYVGLITSFSC
jgi:arabinoxylan arabinofuranohydrolase